jgi:membrane-bound lytic murein transglycosylase D
MPRLPLYLLLPLLSPAWLTANTSEAAPPEPPVSSAKPAEAAAAADGSAALPESAESPPPAGAPAPTDADDEEEVIGDLFALGQHLFETFAPEEIKERYRFPTREEWDNFAARLERALQANTFGELAAMEEDARAALVALRALPDYSDYADWLEERLDDIRVAQELENASHQPLAKTVPPAAQPQPSASNKLPSDSEPDTAPAQPVVPLYDVWLERMRRRPPPVRAAALVPRLKPVFNEAAIPAALVWLAETESSFNPAARSPVGARGLFQLMPGTAKDLGLRLFPFDERLDPLKSAHSAARYLNRLHHRFKDWPLALAAYNAGPNRVSRLLKEHQAKTFAEIAEALPAETRFYVPKVLATVAVREGVTLEALTAASALPVAVTSRTTASPAAIAPGSR